MSTETMKDYKVCLTCKQRLSISNFVQMSTGHYDSFCTTCASLRVRHWVQKNATRVGNQRLKYNSSERGFIINSISRIFKPSNIDTVNRNVSLDRVYGVKGHMVNINKEELWAELFLHVQRMKDKFPDSDGRLCRYCLQPWTYVRSLPDASKLARGDKHSGGKALRKKTWTNFSVDRFDNHKDYVKGNIVFCCAKCNAVKNSSTKEMWLRFLEVDQELKKESLDNGR